MVGRHGVRMGRVVLLAVPRNCPEDEEGFSPEASHHAAARFNLALRLGCLERGCAFADPGDDLFDLGAGQVPALSLLLVF